MLILWEYVFDLFLGVGHGVASYCEEQLTMICLVLYQGHDFASFRLFLKWCDIWNTFKRVYKCRVGCWLVVCCCWLLLGGVGVYMFSSAKKLDILAAKINFYQVGVKGVYYQHNCIPERSYCNPWRVWIPAGSHKPRRSLDMIPFQNSQTAGLKFFYKLP